jgi:hypothetical protein
VPLKVLDALTRDALYRLEEEAGVAKGDVIYLNRTDGWGRSIIKDLADAGVTAVIAGAERGSVPDPQLLPAFRELGIPFLTRGATGTVVKGKIGQVPSGELEAALQQWQEEQEQREKEKKSAMVEHIFKEYKSERGKEVRKGG